MTMSTEPVRQRRPIILLICGMVAAAVPAAQTGRPSATALEMTAYRALGAKHPDPSIRNADRLAERFLGVDERRLLKEAGSDILLAALAMDTESAWATLGNRGALARAVHVRTRHIDEVVEDSLNAGISQIVNLGAGLDSRAVPNRCPAYRTRLRARPPGNAGIQEEARARDPRLAARPRYLRADRFCKAGTCDGT